MIELLIYLSFLMGNIHGQDVIIPHVINVHYVTPATFYGETQPRITAPLAKPRFEKINSERRNPVQREEYIDGSGTNFKPTPTKLPVNYERISQSGPDRMNRPPNATPNTSVLHASRKASDNINSQIQPDEEIAKPVPEQPSPVPQTSHNTDNTPFVLPPTMNEIVIDPSTNETHVQPIDKNGTKVTIPSRSSFNGDQCPTGQVKVNGKCVQEE